MRCIKALLCFAACVALAGCSDETDDATGADADAGDADACAGVLCGACAPTNFRVEVRTSDEQPAEVVVKGLELLDGACQSMRHVTTCSVRLTAGTHEVTASAPGYATETQSFTVSAAPISPGTCCSCGDLYPTVEYVTIDPIEDLDDGGTDDDAGN